MEFRRFSHRKKANNKRGMLFVLLLFVIIFLWYNMDSWMLLFLQK